MALYPLYCNECKKHFEEFNTKKCPLCGGECSLVLSRMGVVVSCAKEVIFDAFPDGRGSVQDPMVITSKRQLKEEYKKREKDGITYIS